MAGRAAGVIAGKLMILVLVAMLIGTTLASLTDWRKKDSWCEEAKSEPLEQSETCYADNQCCKIDS